MLITYRADEIQHKNKLWRLDNFKFRAFKIAVKKLLDTLEEPPPRPPLPEKSMVETYKSPESLGASMFTNLWSDVMKSDEDFTDAQYQIMRHVERDYPDHPNYTKNQVLINYGFRDALKALDLNPKGKTKDESR